MNTFKKTGGFTLVELIIVIAILAILSSVAVAGYSTYIKRANDSAVQAELNNISTSATLANAISGAITTIEVEYTEDSTTELTVVITAKAFAGANGADFLADLKASYPEASDATYAAGDSDTDPTVTFKMAAPSAWANSEYADGTTWNGSTWSK